MSKTPTLSLEIDGRTYVLRPKEVNAFAAATFKASTGRSVEQLLAAIDTGEDDELGLVEVAQFAYLAALQDGTGETFEDVASAMSYDSAFGAMTATGIPKVDPDAEEGAIDLEEDEDDDDEADPGGPAPEDPPLGLVGSKPAGSENSPASAEVSSPS
jgi:hypothetical protein